jgi:hypothetical protein
MVDEAHAYNTTKAAPIAKPYHSLNELLSIKEYFDS